jgi:DNA-binding winged helix-turn-helix (wHTH) protein
VTLVELLAHSGGELLTYECLYSDILGRSFRGDTSNMRVLLGKLTASLQPIGIGVRRWVEVIPKTGYRYKASEM